MKKLFLSAKPQINLLALLAVFIFFAVNLIAYITFSQSRMDLTKGKVYSFSESSISEVQSIDEPIKLTVFFSDNLGQLYPKFYHYAKRVKDVLQTLSAQSEGKLVVEVIAPEAFSKEEDLALEMGIQSLPLGTTGQKAYFGLVGQNSIDQQESIAFLDPNREKFLEYDLLSLIQKLNRIDKQKLTIVSSLPLAGLAGDAEAKSLPKWRIYELLETLYDVTFVASDAKEIPQKTDLLMIVHPKALKETLAYSIDQYILRGGATFICLDPYSEIDYSFSHIASKHKKSVTFFSEFDKFLEKWGIEFTKEKIVGDLDLSEKMNIGTQTSPQLVNHLPWLNLTGEGVFEKTSPVTGFLDRLKTLSMGAFSLKKETNGVVLTPLVLSSQNSQLIDVKHIQSQQPDPAKIMQIFDADDKKYILAARLQGGLESIFPEGLNKADSEEEKNKVEHLKISAKPANIILIGDIDFLYDLLWMQRQKFYDREVFVPISNNADFVMNSLENLSGGTTLSAIRGKGQSFAPFTLLEDMQKQAEKKYLAKEQDLKKELQEAQLEMQKLQKAALENIDSKDIEQAKKLQDYQNKILKIRQDLRLVQFQLRKDVEEFQFDIKMLNIFLVPFLLVVFLSIIAVARRFRRKGEMS